MREWGTAEHNHYINSHTERPNTFWAYKEVGVDRGERICLCGVWERAVRGGVCVCLCAWVCVPVYVSETHRHKFTTKPCGVVDCHGLTGTTRDDEKNGEQRHKQAHVDGETCTRRRQNMHTL